MANKMQLNASLGSLLAQKSFRIIIKIGKPRILDPLKNLPPPVNINAILC